MEIRNYVLRRLARSLVSVVALLLTVGALCAALSEGCAPSLCNGTPGLGAWLSGAARSDFGQTVDNQQVTAAIGAALPATLLLLAAALLFGALIGWGGGIVLGLAECGNRPRSPIRRVALQGGRSLAALAAICQGVPIFWLGGLLVGVFAVGAGWLPPGGIATPNQPAFGTNGYLDALRAQPFSTLSDLLQHLLLPALTLALAGLATSARLFRVTLPAIWRTPHMRVARAAGLSRRRLARRALRQTLPVVLAGSAAATPLLASSLVLVEYLYGWPGLGLLAYQAARAGDIATLGALLLLFGLAVIVVGLLADSIAAALDPRRE